MTIEGQPTAPYDLTAATTGDEKVANGNFSAGTSWSYGWTGGGWTRDGTNNEADCSGAQTAGVDLEQNISAVASESYILQYKIKNYVAGTLTPQIGGVDGTAREATGTYEDYITATGTGNLKFQADSDFNGSVDDVTVKEVMSVNTIRVAWTLGATYQTIYLYHKPADGDWNVLDTLDGTDTSYEHESVVGNKLHYYYVYGYHSIYTEPSSDPSNSDSAAYWADNISDEVEISESVDEYATGIDVSDVITDTMYVSDFVVDATEIKTNYVYYVATAAGKVYEYSGFHPGDAGTAITARWVSKDTDFADQSIEDSAKFKTVEFMRLFYTDKSAGATVSLKLSTDGGRTWTTKTKNIGNGDNTGKTEDFYFAQTGTIFTFAIESISPTDDFQWAGIEIFYNPGGDGF